MTTLRKVLTALMGWVTVSFPAAAQDVTWNVSLWGSSRAVTVGLETLAEQVRERTDGAFDIVLHFAEAISPPRENLDGLAIGAFEAAHICPSYHPGKTPALLGLELPFLPFKDIRMAHQVALAAHQHPAIQQELGRFNAQVLMHVIAPRYEFMGRGEPPVTLDMWQNSRVRAPGNIGDGVRALGGRPTSVPAPEIYTSLERGLFDAAALPFSFTFASYRVHEVAEWYTFNMKLAMPSCVIVVSRDAWASLPDSYRALIEELKPGAYDAAFGALANEDTTWLPEFERAGLQRIIYDEAELEAFRARAAEPLWGEWVERNARRFPAREFLDFLLAEAEKLSGTDG